MNERFVRMTYDVAELQRGHAFYCDSEVLRSSLCYIVWIIMKIRS